MFVALWYQIVIIYQTKLELLGLQNISPKNIYQDIQSCLTFVLAEFKE